MTGAPLAVNENRRGPVSVCRVTTGVGKTAVTRYTRLR